MYAHPPPPAPPPKPGSHEASRMGTPTASQFDSRPSSYHEAAVIAAGELHSTNSGLQGAAGPTSAPRVPQPQDIPDPGDQWLPRFLEDKSKQDLATILSTPALLTALTHSPQTVHPSLAASHTALQAALAENTDLATHLLELEARLAHQRSATQAQLLSTHALERAWRAKQADMDHALAPFAPARLYQRLGAGVQEQGGVCAALEESFVEGEGPGGGALATEREVGEWVRRYREQKKLYYLRQERKERWDEGRVGGWR